MPRSAAPERDRLSVPERPDGRPATREHVLVLPSVACANAVVETVARRLPTVATVVHQHGCSQLGDDGLLTAETLAAFGSHPNVRRTIVVSLGCEDVRACELARRIRAGGGDASVVSIQGIGGVERAVEAVEADVALAGVDALPRCDRPPAAMTVALVVDRAARDRHGLVVDAVRERLERDGFAVAEPADADEGPAREESTGSRASVVDAWRGGEAPYGDLVDMLAGRTAPKPRMIRHDVQRLTVLTAMGAQLAVMLTGRGTPVGSPIVPTLKVSVDPRLDALGDVIDVPAAGADLPGRVVSEVRRVASGALTKAEVRRASDFELWRIGPNY